MQKRCVCLCKRPSPVPALDLRHGRLVVAWPTPNLYIRKRVYVFSLIDWLIVEPRAPYLLGALQGAQGGHGAY